MEWRNVMCICRHIKGSVLYNKNVLKYCRIQRNCIRTAAEIRLASFLLIYSVPLTTIYTFHSLSIVRSSLLFVFILLLLGTKSALLIPLCWFKTHCFYNCLKSEMHLFSVISEQKLLLTSRCKKIGFSFHL